MVKQLMLALTQASPVRLLHWLCATMCSHTGPVRVHKRLMATAMRPSHGSFWFTALGKEMRKRRYTRLPQIRTDTRQCPRLLRYRYPQGYRRINLSLDRVQRSTAITRVTFLPLHPTILHTPSIIH